MARILWLADALRAEDGLRVVETNGWETRGYDELTNPLVGAMFHHTATPIGVDDDAPLHTIIYGRSDLPGPIANVMVGRDGTAYVVASGKANHAGLGGPWRGVPLNDGNRHIFGLEVVNNGVGEEWTDTVLDAVDRVFAAVLRHIEKDESWVLGHKEWTTRKIDPSLNMDAYRVRLGQYLRGDDMTDTEKAQLAEALRTARWLDGINEGMSQRLRGEPEPTSGGATLIGWRRADRFLLEPPTSSPTPHKHELSGFTGEA